MGQHRGEGAPGGLPEELKGLDTLRAQGPHLKVPRSDGSIDNDWFVMEEPQQEGDEWVVTVQKNKATGSKEPQMSKRVSVRELLSWNGM